MSTVIYLHGFLSAPQSKKAQQTAAWLRQHHPDWNFVCPLLSPHTRIAQQTIVATLEKIEGKKFLIGSSLGGFWSTWALEQGLADKAVLINPAVKPYRRFRLSLGETFQHYYSNERYTINNDDLDALEACSLDNPTKLENYWVLLQKEDEILDYRFAEKYYQGCRLLVEEGGDHSFVDYDQHLPAIYQFFKDE